MFKLLYMFHDLFNDVFFRDFLRFFFASQLDFDEAFFEVALSDSDPKRDTDKITILEFDTGPFISVIKEHVYSSIKKLLVHGTGKFHGFRM
jgi:hypothetical protein